MKFLEINTRKLIFTAIILIVNIIIISFFDSFLKNEVCKNGIISFELAQNLSFSKSILNSWNAEAKMYANYSLYVDFIFLVVYSFFIAVFIWKTPFKIKKVFVFAIFIAAFFDVIENIALLNLTHNHFNQLWSSIAFYSAIIKFSLISICLLYLILSGFFKLIKTN